MSTHISLTHYPEPEDIAREIAAADEETQVAFLVSYAKRLTPEKRHAILAEVQAFAEEDDSIALMRLARAINERDAGPDIEA